MNSDLRAQLMLISFQLTAIIILLSIIAARLK